MKLRDIANIAARLRTSAGSMGDRRLRRQRSRAAERSVAIDDQLEDFAAGKDVLHDHDSESCRVCVESVEALAKFLRENPLRGFSGGDPRFACPEFRRAHRIYPHPDFPSNPDAPNALLGALLLPGSDEALELGCTCPVLDNAHGRGYMGVSGTYVYSADCPLHNPTWRTST